MPKGLPLEVLANYCFLCERPRRLLVPQPIRGQRQIWRLPAATAAQFAPALRTPPQVGGVPLFPPVLGSGGQLRQLPGLRVHRVLWPQATCNTLTVQQGTMQTGLCSSTSAMLGLQYLRAW